MSQNIDNSLTNLIVNYLPQNMTDKELFSMFVTIGPVDNCRVMRDNKTGYSYGFGFVNFNRPEDAEKAISQLSGLQIQNKRLKVSYARPSSEDIKDTNLYISNLPRAITEQQLENIFSKFGKIVQKNILKDKITGFPRGVAFVRYDKRSEAIQALTEMNGKVPEGCVEPLNIKIAEEHGKRKAAYYAGYHAGYSQNRGARRVSRAIDKPCIPVHDTMKHRQKSRLLYSKWELQLLLLSDQGNIPRQNRLLLNNEGAVSLTGSLAAAGVPAMNYNNAQSVGGGIMKSDLAKSRRSLLYPYLVPSSVNANLTNMKFK